MTQVTNTILMIRPVQFRMNEQTAVNNYYQQSIDDLTNESIQNKALQEFDAMVDKLRNNGVKVLVVDDTKTPNTPDSIFPNNWVSFHSNGDIGLYPMFAENRRLERSSSIFDLLEKEGFFIDNIIDYTSAEQEALFLEGTGSMVLDRANKIAYCALSPRADEDLFIEFCEDFEYTPVVFNAYQTVNDKRKLIYHTNVMMSIAETFAIVCLESIDDKKERKNVLLHLKESGKEVISISEKQVASFAGNMLQVMTENNDRLLVMSEAAYKSLTKQQICKIEQHCNIVYSSLTTIETCGGGSARCMMAEVFLPKQLQIV